MRNLDMRRHTTRTTGVGTWDREARDHVVSLPNGGQTIDYPAIAKANIDAACDDVLNGYTRGLVSLFAKPTIHGAQGALKALLAAGSPVLLPLAIVADIGRGMKDSADAALAGVMAVCHGLASTLRPRGVSLTELASDPVSEAALLTASAAEHVRAGRVTLEEAVHAEFHGALRAVGDSGAAYADLQGNVAAGFSPAQREIFETMHRVAKGSSEATDKLTASLESDAKQIAEWLRAKIGVGYGDKTQLRHDKALARIGVGAIGPAERATVAQLLNELTRHVYAGDGISGVEPTDRAAMTRIMALSVRLANAVRAEPDVR